MYCFGVSIFDFEQVNAGRGYDLKTTYMRYFEIHTDIKKKIEIKI